MGMQRIERQSIRDRDDAHRRGYRRIDLVIELLVGTKQRGHIRSARNDDEDPADIRLRLRKVEAAAIANLGEIETFVRRSDDLHGTDHRKARERGGLRSEEHTSELQSRENLVCRLLLEKKKKH